MNFTNLEYFLLLAEELNFTKAANKLYISQQSLSVHIAKLEKYFNIKLFDRNNPITLTPAGKCLYIRAKEIFETKSILETEMDNIKNNIIDEITIGATISRGSLILPFIIKKFQEEYPFTKINIYQESSSKKLEEALYKGKVDIIIGFTPSDITAITSIFFCKEEFFIVVPKKILEKYFPNKEEVIMQEFQKSLNFNLLKDCPFIKMDSKTYAGKVFDDIFKEQKLKPNVYINISNIETMLSLCEEGLGIIIIPKIFITTPLREKNRLEFEKKNYYFSIQIPENNFTISLSYLKKKKLSFNGKEFIRIAKELGKEYNLD
ncbi:MULTISPECIES: LysR family transcriptional regulator [Fusobacterium]|uniref:LysR family transcriptional regulator n=1 Tax=Fusobacterium TaxID=848 RepID=UPI001476A55C|nr:MULTISPECIES: LysR family transcriptional regulator [Fusobacterium]NME36294.1 LysR family transcriptional regulator [Fusobacterium sp. FSA-380-WT-3A]